MNLCKLVWSLCLLFVKEVINLNYDHYVVKLDSSYMFHLKITLKEALIYMCVCVWTEKSENLIWIYVKVWMWFINNVFCHRSIIRITL